MISSRDIFHPSHDISSPEIIRRGPPRFPGKLCAGSCSRIMLTMPLRLVLRGRRNIFYFSFYSFISLSLSLFRGKDKRGMEYSKITVTTLPKTDIITYFFPGKNVSISLCVRASPSITQNAFKPRTKTRSRFNLRAPSLL